MRKDLDLFSLVLRSMTKLRENFANFLSFFDKFCGSYKTFFFGPKNMLKTQIFEKKSFSPVKERHWPIFFRVIRFDEPQGTAFKGS